MSFLPRRPETEPQARGSPAPAADAVASSSRPQSLALGHSAREPRAPRLRLSKAASWRPRSTRTNTPHTKPHPITNRLRVRASGPALAPAQFPLGCAGWAGSALYDLRQQAERRQTSCARIRSPVRLALFCEPEHSSLLRRSVPQNSNEGSWVRPVRRPAKCPPHPAHHCTHKALFWGILQGD